MLFELENDILKKYNYTFSDFEEDDGRDLFDLNDSFIGFQNILDKYFARPLQHKIKKDLENYDEIREEFNKIYDALCVLENKDLDYLVVIKLINNLIKELK